MATLIAVSDLVNRTDMVQEPLAEYPVLLSDFRVHDAVQTNLPGTAANDDLAIISGTLGSADPSLRSSDAKATTIAQYARVQIPLPPEYDAGETVGIVLYAGMNTTISDDTATCDVQCYRNGGGSDICASAAQNMNSLTPANKTFFLTPTGLVPGDLLDVRIAISIADTATGTAVIGEIHRVTMICDIKG